MPNCTSSTDNFIEAIPLEIVIQIPILWIIGHLAQVIVFILLIAILHLMPRRRTSVLVTIGCHGQGDEQQKQNVHAEVAALLS